MSIEWRDTRIGWIHDDEYPEGGIGVCQCPVCGALLPIYAQWTHELWHKESHR